LVHAPALFRRGAYLWPLVWFMPVICSHLGRALLKLVAAFASPQ